MGDMPATELRAALQRVADVLDFADDAIEGGVRSRPETVDAVAAVVREWRALAPGVRSQHLFEALAALDARWPQ